MMLCDLCGQARECSKKEIENREYDICSECWKPIAEKLNRKGRQKKNRETVFLPPLVTSPQTEPQKPEPKPPGEPPKIWSSVGRA